MFIALGAISFMAFRFFMHTSRVHETKFSGQSHRLGASNEAAEDD